jgi:2-iminobutanoate/2-iminopropanoate deaminase
MKQIIYTPNAPAPIGPYSQAVLADNTLYVSGQIAINPETDALETADIHTETHRVLTNLQAVVHAAGFQMTDVVKCSIFIADMGQFAAINEVYGQFFKSWKPARETVEVACLPKNVHVEISAIAVRDAI